jgi:hypothetical protein
MKESNQGRKERGKDIKEGRTNIKEWGRILRKERR